MQKLDLYNVIGQLYVNLITAQGAIKELKEQFDKTTQEQNEAEQVSRTRDPVPL